MRLSLGAHTSAGHSGRQLKCTHIHCSRWVVEVTNQASRAYGAGLRERSHTARDDLIRTIRQQDKGMATLECRVAAQEQGDRTGRHIGEHDLLHSLAGI